MVETFLSGSLNGSLYISLTVLVQNRIAYWNGTTWSVLGVGCIDIGIERRL